ncbi:Uncharacterized protein APZ42_002168 [Daphnia magna]|uniref:Uncharacterized protein n=1 Tax=Daphnia magna TaxID=35525 RepID=A0A0P5YVE4_9CRUS|nr:Uncharacterized protein APZ42_002168 [Daphnia magna]
MKRGGIIVDRNEFKWRDLKKRRGKIEVASITVQPITKKIASRQLLSPLFNTRLYSCYNNNTTVRSRVVAIFYFTLRCFSFPHFLSLFFF